MIALLAPVFLLGVVAFMMFVFSLGKGGWDND